MHFSLLQSTRKIHQSLRKEFLVGIGLLGHRVGNLVTRLQLQNRFDGVHLKQQELRRNQDRVDGFRVGWNAGSI
jgi:hypothetical protein